MGDGADVGVFGAGRVGTGALEQHELGAAGITGGEHCIIKLAEAGHAGGDDQGLAGGSSLLNQRQVVVLEAGDLVSGDTKIFKEVDCSFITREAEADQAQLTGPLHDRAVPLPGGVCLFVEVVEVLASPEGIGITDVEAAATHVERHRVGGVSRQRDRMGARLSCRFHDRQDSIQALVAVAAHLSNHKRGMVYTDWASGHFDRHGAREPETAGPGKKISMAVKPSASWPQG